MLGYVRSISTGAFSTLILFLICWAGAAVGWSFGFSHAFVGLFALEPVASLNALLIGSLSAFLAGGVGGAIIAHCYNLAGRWWGE